MQAEVRLGDQVFRVDLSTGHSIAREIPFALKEASCNAPFDLQAVLPQSATWRKDDFIGDVSQGGSCNVRVLMINPHCGGTHTETLLHLLPTDSLLHQPTIGTVAPTGLLPALVLTVSTASITDVSQSEESLTEHAQPADRVVTANAIKAALAQLQESQPIEYAAWEAVQKKSLVLRIFQNDPAAPSVPWTFASAAAPYFSVDAIRFMNHQSVQHLLVEFPSIDRMRDGGHLVNHHQFWNVEPQTKRFPESSAAKTITEMIEVPRFIKDGLHLLSIQLPPALTDAMLSRPVLFPVTH